MAKVNFFLVFEGRAGSGLLRAILNSSPHVVFEAEWLMFDLRKHADAARRQVEQVSTFFHDPRYADLACLGFDNKLSDIIDPPAFADALMDEGARLLVLKRRNIAKQVISSLNALRTREVTGKFHAYSESDILDQPFELDPDRFDAHLRRLVTRLEEVDRFVAGHDWPHLEIFYEDLTAERAAVVGRIAEFLEAPLGGIELEPPRQPLKQSPTDLRRLISNHEELLERYRGTPVETMLADRSA